MGCRCASDCNKNPEELAEFNDNNPIYKIYEMLNDNHHLLQLLIKLQSYFRGMKLRNDIKPVLNEIHLRNNNSIQQNMISESFLIIEEELNTLLETYPPLDDNIQVELIFPIEYPKENIIYYGEWDVENNVRHGRGILLWPDGSKYVGYWVKDKASIRGKLIHNDGDIYEGEWLDDQPNGKGIYIHKEGTIYEGDWKNDKQDGYGKEKWLDGAYYEGEYKDGKKNGKGKFCWSDGSYYEGNFRNNEINGKGIYIFKDKRKIEGNWVNNKLEGYGVVTWPDGRKFEGNYKNDKREGFGELIWKNGKKYKGNWKNGMQSGEGEFFFPSLNEWKRGIWEKGKIVKWIERNTVH